MDSLEDRDDPVVDIQASESASRFVAYASPYLFWLTIFVLTAGIVLLQ